jgi:starch synthase (maltosyl-transferring)
VVLARLLPEVEGGRFPAKREAGETVEIEAHAFTDGHDLLAVRLHHRRAGGGSWQTTPMDPLGNDRYGAAFLVERLGEYEYTADARLDRYRTWAAGLAKKADAGQDVRVDLLVGAALLEEAAARAGGRPAALLAGWAAQLGGEAGVEERVALAARADVAEAMDAAFDPADLVEYGRVLPLAVDRPRARFSTWYEMFPRSASPAPGRPGTLRDCAARLPYVAGMGFDVLYLPPIHPIGRTHRKGRNNAVRAAADDPGSPWAIGGAEGGHKAVHPALGTLDDFAYLVREAAAHGMEVALDVAFQCSPDHPYVRDHPEWFRRRPDGSVQYAENPPKKYEDIYPFDFESPAWRALWDELLSIFTFWIGHGVRAFRVDNPHTKPFAFWEWLIAEVRRDHPDVIFLSEAFTRPKVMYRLAQLGFTQSYTYFAWRNHGREIREYFEELSRPPVSDFFRPNLWPNTPDILTEHLQTGGRGAFMARLVLAATLGASYGIYGPAFELGLHRPRSAGSEEYVDSEKYEVRHWDLEAPGSLAAFIARVNRARRQNPALQADRGLVFHPCDNERLLCYSKATAGAANVVITAVNLDPRRRQAGWVALDLEALGLEADETFQVHDVLTDARYPWRGPRNYVELDPEVVPAHVFVVRRQTPDGLFA